MMAAAATTTLSAIAGPVRVGRANGSTVIAVEQRAREVPPGLRALRRARRRNSLAKGDWADRLYQAYLAVIAVGLFTWFFASIAAGNPASAAQLHWIDDHGAAVVGMVAALAITVGLRSGARGGPLSLELTTVHYELLAPIERRVTLRHPATQHLSHLALFGGVAGAVAALVAGPSLPDNPVVLFATATAAGVLVAIAAVGAALIVSGLRLSAVVANSIGVALLALATFDLVSGHGIAPTTPFGVLALWSRVGSPAAVVAPVLAVALAVLGVRYVAGTSIERARERAGLVEQLRFALTMQDLRTVVLLRRHLAHEQLRVAPWIALPMSDRGGPRRRAVRGLLHFRVGRMVRMLLLGVSAGLLIGWSSDIPALLVPAAGTLFLAGYDAVEALGQEVDHPKIWSSHPVEHPGHILGHLLQVGIAACLPVTVVATIAAALVTGVGDGRLVPLLLVGVLGAFGAGTGAAVSTVLGPPDMVAISRYGAPDMIGWVLVIRAILPLLLTFMALLPALGLRHHTSDDIVSSSTNLIGPAIVAVVLGWQWLRSRTPRTL